MGISITDQSTLTSATPGLQPPIADLEGNISETGWRLELVESPDGIDDYIEIPLTEEEFIHPEEGYHLPSNTFHDDIGGSMKDLLTRRYANDDTTGVFRDLNIVWGVEGVKKMCPDTFVAFNIRDKQTIRTEFNVPSEGTTPAFVVEVVSPRYRTADRVKKVRKYAQAGVQEYAIFDRRKQRGQWCDEVLGYRLVDGIYLPLVPDEDGLLFFATVNLRIGMHDKQVILIDETTGNRLLTASELEQRAADAQQQAADAQQQAADAQQQARQAEKRAAKLAEVLRSQGIDPDSL
jgi:Uma2 family endonuclease